MSQAGGRSLDTIYSDSWVSDHLGSQSLTDELTSIAQRGPV